MSKKRYGRRWTAAVLAAVLLVGNTSALQAEQLIGADSEEILVIEDEDSIAGDDYVIEEDAELQETAEAEEAEAANYDEAELGIEDIVSEAETEYTDVASDQKLDENEDELEKKMLADLEAKTDELCSGINDNVEKVKAIANYITSTYPYSAKHYTAYNMYYDPETGGDCIANTEMLIIMCSFIGIEVRYNAYADPNNPAHRNGIAKINGKYYVVEVGSSGGTDRGYDIHEHKIPYYYIPADGGGVIINAYIGFDPEVVIPETISGAKVVGISENCFYRSNVRATMTKVTIPETVKSIGTGAFKDCINLQEITIPKSVTEIGTGAFARTTALSSIKVESGSTSFKTVDGCLYTYSGDELLAVPVKSDGKYTIAEGCKRIGDRVFYDMETLSEVKLPSTLKEIGQEAFAETSLTKLDLPDGLERIEEDATFQSRLDYLTIPESVKYLGTRAIDCKEVTIYARNFQYDEGPVWGGFVFVYKESSADKATPYKYLGDDKAYIDENGKVPLREDWFVVQDSSEVTYSGAEHRKEIRCSYWAPGKGGYGPYFMRENQEYTLTYENNVNAGTAYIVMTGKGQYTGKVRIPFTINPYDLSKGSVIYVDENTCIYNEVDPCEPDIRVVTSYGLELKKGTDYTAVYSNNTASGQKGRVTVTGKGNFTGSQSWTFYIYSNHESLSDVDKAGELSVSSDIPGLIFKPEDAATREDVSVAYNGSEHKPALQVKRNGVLLKENVDYTLEYSNNTSGGVAQINIRGIGHYYGITYRKFEIKALDISQAVLSWDSLVVPSGEDEYSFAEKHFKVTVGGVTLQEGTDYYVFPDTTRGVSGERIIRSVYIWTMGKNVSGDLNNGSVTFTGTGAGTYQNGSIAWRDPADAGNSSVVNTDDPDYSDDAEYTWANASLEPFISLNVSGTLKMQTKQKCKKLLVSMQEGDSAISWTSSKPGVVKVTGNVDGTCTLKAGKKTGKAVITIRLASGLEKSLTVKVQKAKVTTGKVKVTNAAKKVTLKKGSKLALLTELTPITSQDKVTYTSSRASVVKVSKKGLLTAKKAGKATITVKAGKKKVKIKVTVTK